VVGVLSNASFNQVEAQAVVRKLLRWAVWMSSESRYTMSPGEKDGARKRGCHTQSLFSNKTWSQSPVHISKRLTIKTLGNC